MTTFGQYGLLKGWVEEMQEKGREPPLEVIPGDDVPF